MKLTDVSGWLGMALVHGSTLPTTLSAIFGQSSQFPPLSMVLMLWSGLLLFLIQSIATKNKLYTASNGIGLIFQSALLIIMLVNTNPL